MKLFDITTKILTEHEIEGETFVIAASLHEGIGNMFAGIKDKKGGIIPSIQQIGKFITNPVVSGIAIGYAVDAYSTYQKNKHRTTKLFAKFPSEKPFYEKMVKELMKTGHYKLISTKSVEGGTLWELRRS